MKNFNIITLGSTGAGKTVFLASIFKQLAVQGGKFDFFLEVPDTKESNFLTNVYDTLITKEVWPEGTRRDNISKWVFTCCVKNDFDIYRACQFTYWDYAGVMITDYQKNDLDFKKNVQDKTYDAVLAILDGVQVCNLMENKDVRSWLLRDVTNIALIIQSCGEIPVHFIISKYDVLYNKGHKLQEIRKCLLEKSEEFKRVVEQRKGRQLVRLIPVSSVGMTFATLQSDGKMEKNINIIPEPYNLEIPLTYVMTDPLNKQLQNLPKRGWLNFIALPIIDLIRSQVDDDFDIFNLRRVKDEKTALTYAIRCFKKIQSDFMKDFPDSDLHQ